MPSVARPAPKRYRPLANQRVSTFTHYCRDETQASLESIIFSFLTIEATINYIFFNEQRSRQPGGMDRWLREKWKRQLRVYDRFVILVIQYSTGTLDEFPSLITLLSEFIAFRNRIVHAHPEEYDALVEPGKTLGEVLVHDVEPVSKKTHSSLSGLSQEIGRIGFDDARRAFEIMLLVLSFLDAQFVAELDFPWSATGRADDVEHHLTPRGILESLDHRCYPAIAPASFVPKFIARIKAQSGRGKID